MSGKVTLSIRITQELDEWVRIGVLAQQRTLGQVVEAALRQAREPVHAGQREDALQEALLAVLATQPVQAQRAVDCIKRAIDLGALRVVERGS